MKHALGAIRAAIRNPRRVLACLRACHGVQLDVIELHDHDYSLAHLRGQLAAAAIMSRQDDKRMQNLVAERNHLAAALRAMLVANDRAAAGGMFKGSDEQLRGPMRSAEDAARRLCPMRPSVQLVGVDTGEE